MTTLPLTQTETLRLRLAVAAVQQAEMQTQFAREQARWMLRELLLRAGLNPDGQEWSLDLDRQQLIRGMDTDNQGHTDATDRRR